MMIYPEMLMEALRQLEQAPEGRLDVDTRVRREGVGVHVVGPDQGELQGVCSSLVSRGCARGVHLEFGQLRYEITDLGRAVLAGEAELPPPPGAMVAGVPATRSHAEQMRALGPVERIGR